MIASGSVVDLINKVRKYERINKEQAERIQVLEELVQKQGMILAKNEDQIGKLKCRTADMKLALKRKVVKDADIPSDEE